MKVTFAGIAPIPRGTKVRILADSVTNPTLAFQIEDKDHGITYTVREATTRLTRAIAGPLDAIVDEALVYASGNKTDLGLTIVKP